MTARSDALARKAKDDALARIKAIVGERGWVAAGDATEPYLAETRGLFRGETDAVVRPASTEEVAQVVRACVAGGTAVLRYGNARDLVLGLEVVLPDGEIWHGLRRLRKDNTGYDLRNLFIGAEGTLGLITAAVLKLYPRPLDSATALVAVRDVHAAVELLARARGETGDAVSTFEIMNRYSLDIALKHVNGT